MKCKQCGEENLEGSTFCKKCGKNFTEEIKSLNTISPNSNNVKDLEVLSKL